MQHQPPNEPNTPEIVSLVQRTEDAEKAIEYFRTGGRTIKDEQVEKLRNQIVNSDSKRQFQALMHMFMDHHHSSNTIDIGHNGWSLTQPVRSRYNENGEKRLLLFTKPLRLVQEHASELMKELWGDDIFNKNFMEPIVDFYLLATPQGLKLLALPAYVGSDKYEFNRTTYTELIEDLSKLANPKNGYLEDGYGYLHSDGSLVLGTEANVRKMLVIPKNSMFLFDPTDERFEGLDIVQRIISINSQTNVIKPGSDYQRQINLLKTLPN